MALSLEGLPAERVGELRGKYGDITIPSLEEVIKEIMSSESVQPKILIGEATGQHDITETTKQLMIRLLTAVSVTVCVYWTVILSLSVLSLADIQ